MKHSVKNDYLKKKMPYFKGSSLQALPLSPIPETQTHMVEGANYFLKVVPCLPNTCHVLPHSPNNI